MIKVSIIAYNTFREAIRDKILYNLLIFALLIILGGYLLSTLTFGEQSKIILDLGLASMNLFGVLIAIFVGIGLVSKEIDRRTIYTIVTKPVARYQFLLGKYLGLVLTLLVNLAIMVVGFYCSFYLQKTGWQFLAAPEVHLSIGFYKAVFLIFMELMIVTGVAIFFSTFTTTTLAAIFTLFFYVIGHTIGTLKELGSKLANPISKSLLDGIYYLLPNLEKFNIKTEVVHNMPISINYMLMSTLYGILYISALLLLASLIFQKRDFK
jgi:ABC-type transport system involved in multi-copper enzyme maturation permease subunit